VEHFLTDPPTGRRPTITNRDTQQIMPKLYSPESAENGGAAAVDRALTIVAALEEAASPLTLADIARSTGLYKSTLLRLLISLERSNLVVRRPDQRYALGQFAFRLGRAYEATYRLKECILPVLEWLITQDTESPSFHVEHDRNTRLCMFRLDSKHSTLDRVRAGELLPMARGAAGKVLKAFRNGATFEAGESMVFTSFGERDPSCAALAAPVFGPEGQIAGALSLSGPLERFTATAVKKMSVPLLVAAQTATQSLGGEWPVEPARARAPSAGRKRKEPA